MNALAAHGVRLWIPAAPGEGAPREKGLDTPAPLRQLRADAVRRNDERAVLLCDALEGMWFDEPRARGAPMDEHMKLRAIREAAGALAQAAHSAPPQ